MLCNSQKFIFRIYYKAFFFNYTLLPYNTRAPYVAAAMPSSGNIPSLTPRFTKPFVFDAQNKQQQLQNQLTTLKNNNHKTQQSNSEIQKQVKQLSKQNQTLTSELASIKKISANASLSFQQDQGQRL